MLEIPLLNPGGGGGGLELDACPHTCRRRCCEILLRPFAEQTNFITVGTKTYSPRGVRTFDHALYNLPSVGVFPYKFGRRLIYAIFDISLASHTLREGCDGRRMCSIRIVSSWKMAMVAYPGSPLASVRKYEAR